jgi:hypothetical protein
MGPLFVLGCDEWPVATYSKNEKNVGSTLECSMPSLIEDKTRWSKLTLQCCCEEVIDLIGAKLVTK